MKTALVTGGAGFLGSHLCDFLLGKGYKVICLDNLITGDDRNIRHNRGNPNFVFMNHDVTKPIEIGEGVDLIFHAASPASPVDFLKYPIQTLKVGALGTHNMLGLARKKKARILLTSTSEVYGDPLVHPQKETYHGNVNPIGPRGVYDEAKRFAEAMAMAYHKSHGIEVRIARIFNTYGPRMKLNDGRAVPNFVYQALKGMPITIHGDGKQTRSFCYVSDTIDGLYRLMMSDYAGPVNIGNPNEMKIIELAEKIIEMTGSKGGMAFKQLPEDDPKVRRPDISLARETLGWEPKVGLDEGLRKTIGWFKENMGGIP